MEKLLDLGKGLWVAKISTRDLIEQDVNPRSMGREMFRQFSENVKNRGILESLPYCAETEKGIEIISGHHRTRVARDAEIEDLFILLDCSGLKRDDIIAKQLAHNSISGVDDPELVKRLYLEIQNIDRRIECYIDPKGLELMLKPVEILDVNSGIEFKTINLSFLPGQVEDVKGVIGEILKFTNKNDSELWISDIKYFEEFRDTINKVRKEQNIKSIGMALHYLCENYGQKTTEDLPIEQSEQVKA